MSHIQSGGPATCTCNIVVINQIMWDISSWNVLNTCRSCGILRLVTPKALHSSTLQVLKHLMLPWKLCTGSTCAIDQLQFLMPLRRNQRVRDMGLQQVWVFFSNLLFLHAQLVNPLIPKIWSSVLPSSYYTFPCKLITRIWCSNKVITCTWWVLIFSLPVSCIMYGYSRERLHSNYFWEFKGWNNVLWFFT